MYYVYLLQSKKDNSFYIGQTDNIENRLKKHNNGLVTSTRGKMPWHLIGYEEYENRNEARWQEYQLKKHSDKKRRFVEKLTSS